MNSQQQQEFLPKNLPNTSSLICWGIISLSIISCCASPDYNIVIAFLLLFFRGLNPSDKQKILSRMKLQIIILSFLFDFFWIIKYNSYWTHGEESSELWQSLSFIHNLAFYFIIIEILLKFPLCYYIYGEFRNNQGEIKELVNFNYKPTKE